MGERVTEVRGQFSDVMGITELRGSYPNVPIDPSVDYAALIAGDGDPKFLTLPIGKVGAVSGNKRYYDEAFVQELERQTLTHKPIGLMGHLSETERATAFPPEAVHWVGALREGDTLWGKAYLVPGAVRDRIQRYRAQGKVIATSIDASADGKWDERLKAYHMDAKTLRLAQIDIAPADRAGIPDLAAVPMLTTEMEAAQVDTPEENNMPPEKGKLEYINEMTVEDARLLPDSVRAAVIATVQTPPEVAQVQELRQVLGVDDKANLAQLITEMRTRESEQRKATVQARITELASAVKVEDVRAVVVEMVNGHKPQTIEEANAAYAQVLEMTSVKNLLATTVQNKMGPRQSTQVQSQEGKPKYVIYPKETD